MSDENSYIKETTVDGWLRDGLTDLTDKMTAGGVLKRHKVSEKVIVQEVSPKDTNRFYVSTMDGGKDVSRGFFRSAVSALFSAGGVLRHWKPVGFFVACYIKAYQWMNSVSADSTYGRFYQSATDCDLSTGGVMRWLKVGDEITIVKVKGVFQAESLLWTDITAASLYDRTEA